MSAFCASTYAVISSEPSNPYGKTSCHSIAPLIINEHEFLGGFSISREIARKGIPGVYKVRLYDRYNGRVIAQRWSGVDGMVVFKRLAQLEKRYQLIALDRSGEMLTPASADFVTPS